MSRVGVFIKLSAFVLSLVTSLSGQKRFDCDGNPLIVASDSMSTAVFRQVSIPFSGPFLSMIAKYKGSFDAVGFNPMDNYLYGVDQSTGTIVRLSQFNTVERIGQMPTSGPLQTFAGDCTADGLYACYDNIEGKMFFFDVTGPFKLVQWVSLSWDPVASSKSGPLDVPVFDFAFDPNDPATAYSFQAASPDGKEKGIFLRINLDEDHPRFGMVTSLGAAETGILSYISGLAFDPRSALYGFGASGTGADPLQNMLYNLEAVTGVVYPVLTHSPAFAMSDACSCPYSLSFTNKAPVEGMFCSGDTKTFVVGFDNNSFLPLTGVVLKDTFPEGSVIKSVSGTFSGTIAPGTGVGTNVLSVSGLLIPAKDRVEISIEVHSVNAQDGPAFNRAYLHNLPPRFPEMVASDDPDSSTPGDRSNFYFITRPLTGVSWKVIPPSDCVLASDGKVVVTSPDFEAGEIYEVSLRNKAGWKEHIKLVKIGQDGSFTLDSLSPGNYQLFRFKPVSDRCSVSLKDTSIVLDPPNNLLDLRAESNSPVCEGQSIRLNSDVKPQCAISWKGPQSFGSESGAPVIDFASPMRTGTYEAIATYGFCSRTSFLDVEVKHKVQTSVIGDTVYCKRDTLRLEAVTTQSGVDHIWHLPDGTLQRTPQLGFALEEDHLSGIYKVVSGNGACYDTAAATIKIKPTPTVTLDPMVQTDLCDPLIIGPQVKGDIDVTYLWQPSEGLSCVDCPAAQVGPVVQAEYRVRVSNKFNCADSAAIRIELDKDNSVFTSNVFSPSGTPENSVFKVIPNCVVHYIHSLDIFDRSGSRVFHAISTGPDENLETWDGTIAGKKASSGVYVWILKVELADGSFIHLTGDVTLL